MAKRIGFFVLVGLMALAESVSPLEAKIQAVRVGDPRKEAMAELYFLRTNAPNAMVAGLVVKACGAGLCYLGEERSYRIVRENIEQVEAFEKKMQVPCERCGGTEGNKGTGRTHVACFSCGGTGQCYNKTSCQGGQVLVHRVAGGSYMGICSICKGTGKCPKCSGSGQIGLSCSGCGGAGTIFSKSTALDLYRGFLEQILSDYEQRRQLAAEQSRQEKAIKLEAEQNRRLKEAEIAAKHEAVVAEAKALGEERARQEAKAKAMEEERLRQIEMEKYYDGLDRDFLKSCVVVRGNESCGTGFIVDFNGRKVLMSNAHVFCGNSEFSLQTTQGTVLAYNNIYICRKEVLGDTHQRFRDVIIYELVGNVDVPALKICDVKNQLLTSEDVVVFGNSEGQGVVTTIRGKVKGVGPTVVEVDAKFVRGNSGSPVIAYPYKSVVGIATYAMQKPKVDWANRGTGFDEVRRFASRVDDLKWEDFEQVDMIQYARFLDIFKQISSFSLEQIKRNYGYGRFYNTSSLVREEARRLLDLYSTVPAWYSTYSEGAVVGAYVCTLLLK